MTGKLFKGRACFKFKKKNHRTFGLKRTLHHISDKLNHLEKMV